jgi:hypothetical protein
MTFAGWRIALLKGHTGCNRDAKREAQPCGDVEPELILLTSTN